MSFPRYTEVKDSGVEWLGEVPAHWNVTPGRRLYSQKRDPAKDNDEQLSATQKYGVVPQRLFMQLEDQKVTLALSGLDSFKHVNADDFVISLRSFQGGIERSKYDGCVSPAYTVLRSVGQVDANFVAYVLKSNAYIATLQSVTDGIRDGKSISYEQFGQIGLPRPSMTEQAAIAAFLDRETAKIDGLVAEQEKLIALLKEKCQAVISHAVTKGLNPDAPMKDSGIEWLGEVPAHWAVGKCGFYLTILSGYAFPSSGFVDDEDATRLLRGINVGVSRIKWDETVYWHRKAGDGLEEYQLCPGDLVIGMDRPLIGDGMRVARLQESDVPCLLLQRVAAVKPKPALLTDFLHLLLSSEFFIAHFHPDTTGVSVPHISPEQINNYVIPIPPIAEQQAIVEVVLQQKSSFERLAAESTCAIDLLRERRSALISAAVTGKIDVRGWVAEADAA